MYAPLVKTIEVPCTPTEAFAVFVNQMDTWWPLAQFSASHKFGTTAKGLRVDPRVGGQIVETCTDGTEHLWGTITTYDPPTCVRMDLHIGLPAETASVVEVRFTAIDGQQTRVVLTQSEWERFGEFAEMMYRGYPKGWVAIFDEAFRTACGG